jgi:transposase-like protein
MKNNRHSPEQIIRMLRQADEMLAAGSPTPEICKQLEISEATYHRWRNQYGGMKQDAIKRLRELEKENECLKKMVAEQALDIQILNLSFKPKCCRSASAVDIGDRVEHDGLLWTLWPNLCAPSGTRSTGAWIDAPMPSSSSPTPSSQQARSPRQYT